MGRRVDVRAILKDPVLRKRMLVNAGLAIQHREGVETTREQMDTAYDKVQEERGKRGLDKRPNL